MSIFLGILNVLFVILGVLFIVAVVVSIGMLLGFEYTTSDLIKGNVRSYEECAASKGHNIKIYVVERGKDEVTKKQEEADL